MASTEEDVIGQRSFSILNRRYRKQLLAAIAVQFLTFAHGIVTGWIAPTLLKLQSYDSPTNFTVTVEQVSWIGSLFGLGSMVANLTMGLLINRVGRKFCMYAVALPYMAAWILVYFSKTHIYLYVARFLNGMTGGGNYVVVSIFISEISDPSVRGALTSMAMLFLSFGIITGFLLSSHLDYYLNPCIIIMFPIIYMMAVIPFPETPQHLLRKQKIDEARKAFRFYKNLPKETSLEDVSCKQQEVEINAEFEQLKNYVLSNNGKSQELTLKDFVSGESLKALGCVLILLVINQFSGSFAFFNYMSDIFARTGSDIDPNTSTIAMGIVQAVGIILTMTLSDRFGRKFLMTLSTSGMAMGLLVFGFYIQLATAEMKLKYNWFPLVAMAFIILVSSVGVVGLTFTLIVENLPAKIRSPATSMSMGCLSFTVFVVLKIFPLMLDSYGLATVLFCCAGVCVLGCLFVLLGLKETKGLYLDK